MRDPRRAAGLPGLSAAQRLLEAARLGRPVAAEAPRTPAVGDPVQVPRPSPAHDGDLEPVLAVPAAEPAADDAEEPGHHAAPAPSGPPAPPGPPSAGYVAVPRGSSVIPLPERPTDRTPDSSTPDSSTPDSSTSDSSTPDGPPEAGVPEPAPGSEDEVPLALVRRAQAGDAEAFAALYDRYLPMVYRYISYRVGSRPLAEDLTSETFARALRRLDSYSWQGRDVGAWLVTIARHLVTDHYRSGHYRLELTTADVADAAPGLVSEGPEGEVLAGLTTAALLDAVRQLGPDQQECIALRFLQGLSVAETARVMERNEGAVKALQGRAVRNLGRLLPPGLEP